MNLIYQDKSLNEIVKKEHIARSITQEYRSKGAPYLRDALRTLNLPPPTSWAEERTMLLQYIQKTQHHENELIIENSMLKHKNDCGVGLFLLDRPYNRDYVGDEFIRINKLSNVTMYL